MLLAGNRQNVASAPTTDSASRRNSDTEDPMLVLTRRGGESVRIGDDVTVTVLEDGGRPVRLGIDAPKEIPVHREEVGLARNALPRGARVRVVALGTRIDPL